MKWQELDAKRRRNAIVFAAIVAAMLAVLLWPSGTSRRRSAPRAIPSRNIPQPGRGTPPAPRPVPPPAKDAGMLGKWQSPMNAQMPGHGLCTLWLEVTRKEGAPDQYTGAASLTCIPTASLTAPKADTPMTVLMDARDPVFASLSGAWQKDAIVFLVDKVVNPKQCGFTGMSVSKFGSQNIAAEFQDACGGGSAVLRKAG